jgi:hypothetical protein
MSAILRILLFGVMLSLVSCREDETNREEARVQQEVARRVEAIRTEMKTDETRWRTIRMATLSLLAGGSLILLLGGYFDRSDKPTSARLAGGEPNTRRRVIDRPYDDPDDDYENPSRWR